ncbi:MAG: translation initiation factor, partial [Pseudomonadota bacterium]
MGQSTVTKFAEELGLPVDLLIEQLKSAGVNKSVAEDSLSEIDKSALLEYLRKEHGQTQVPKNKITLTHKQNKEIKKTDSTGRARTIQVEVRKKRVLVRREDGQPVDTPIVESKPVETVA